MSLASGLVGGHALPNPMTAGPLIGQTGFRYGWLHGWWGPRAAGSSLVDWARFQDGLLWVPDDVL